MKISSLGLSTFRVSLIVKGQEIELVYHFPAISSMVIWKIFPYNVSMSLGKLFLILGPSGAGKGVTIQSLRKRFNDAVFPVSCTTRPARPQEKDGEVYHFLSKQEFDEKIKSGEFLEWAVVHHDHRYGTLKKEILYPLEKGKMVIREVDMQGVESILKILSKDQIVSIFITTKSWEILKDRIMRRQKESDEELEKRRQSYLKEMEFSKQCDYVVESEEGNLMKLCDEVSAIMDKEFSDS